MEGISAEMEKAAIIAYTLLLAAQDACSELRRDILC
jgi:hypothetical protein